MKNYKEITITLNELPKIWRKKIFEFLKLLEKKDIEDTDNIIDYFNSCIYNGLISWIKTSFTDTELESAKKKCNNIINQSEKLGINITCYNDKIFPKSLIKLNDAPLILYSKGALDGINKMKNITIIWTREPTKEWKEVAEWLGKTFSKNWFNIVSWLAKWCDTYAHKWALMWDKWKTTAIIWNWLDKIYPSENKNLANEILNKNWILLSEYPIWTDSTKRTLVERDRLQAWIADIIIWVQFWEKSWTIHALDTAIKQKKAVYVVNFNNMQSLWDKITWNIKYLKSWEAKEITSTNINDIITNINNI